MHNATRALQRPRSQQYYQLDHGRHISHIQWNMHTIFILRILVLHEPTKSP
jgi:hypothetical protein